MLFSVHLAQPSNRCRRRPGATSLSGNPARLASSSGGRARRRTPHAHGPSGPNVLPFDGMTTMYLLIEPLTLTTLAEARLGRRARVERNQRRMTMNHAIVSREEWLTAREALF